MISRWAMAAGLLGSFGITRVLAADPADPAQARLAGTVVSPSGRQGLVQLGTGGGYLELEVGDTLGAWTVEAIEAGAIWLSGNDGRFALTLSGTSLTGPRVAAAASETLSSWTHPCGRVHAPQNSRSHRDTGACLFAVLRGSAGRVSP